MNKPDYIGDNESPHPQPVQTPHDNESPADTISANEDTKNADIEESDDDDDDDDISTGKCIAGCLFGILLIAGVWFLWKNNPTFSDHKEAIGELVASEWVEAQYRAGSDTKVVMDLPTIMALKNLEYHDWKIFSFTTTKQFGRTVYVSFGIGGWTKAFMR